MFVFINYYLSPLSSLTVLSSPSFHPPPLYFHLLFCPSILPSFSSYSLPISISSFPPLFISSSLPFLQLCPSIVLRGLYTQVHSDSLHRILLVLLRPQGDSFPCVCVSLRLLGLGVGSSQSYDPGLRLVLLYGFTPVAFYYWGVLPDLCIPDSVSYRTTETKNVLLNSPHPSFIRSSLVLQNVEWPCSFILLSTISYFSAPKLF